MLSFWRLNRRPSRTSRVPSTILPSPSLFLLHQVPGHDCTLGVPHPALDMRQRITFIHEPGKAIDPALLQITDDSVSGIDISAVREDRLTVPLDELPREISQLFRASCRELHVRWVSPLAFGSVSPLSSRMSPGLHVFVTPIEGVKERSM